MAEIAEILTSAGLSDGESQVYLKLLETGRTSASTLAREMSMARGVVYFILEQLEKKGLVVRLPNGKRFLYQAKHPSELLALIDRKKHELESSKASIGSIIPMLSEMYSSTSVKPVVSYFGGVEGVKKVYLDTLKVGETIYAAMHSGRVNMDVHKWVREKYVPERVNRGIKAKVIMSANERVEIFKKENKEKLREMIVVDSDIFHVKMEVNIYGNKVGFISSHADADLFGVIIDSPFVAQSMLALWKLAWIGAGGSLPRSDDK